MVRRALLFKLIGLCLGVALMVLGVAAWYVYGEVRKADSEDPLVWEKAISAFEVAAQHSPLPRDAVLFVGSSSIRLWDSLAEDMQPIPVIQRGFGGARLNDLVYYAGRLVAVDRPGAIVVFAGTNDITVDRASKPEQLLRSYQEFVAAVRAKLPEVPIYYIAITPSPRRWPVWPIAQATNRLIEHHTETSPDLHFIDTGDSLLNAFGEPEEDYYAFDGLHLSEEGYAVWAEIIRGRLLADMPSYRGREIEEKTL